MILIADSGSTKTDWCIVFNGTLIKRIGTKGINPFFQSEEEIQQELTASLLPQLPEGTINSVYFYGAGCTPEKAPVLRRSRHCLYPRHGFQLLLLQWRRDYK